MTLTLTNKTLSDCERIHVLHLVNGWRADNVVDSDDVLVFEAQEDFDLSQGALAVRLVLKRADLLNGHTDLVVPIISRAGLLKTQSQQLNTDVVISETDKHVKKNYFEPEIVS